MQASPLVAVLSKKEVCAQLRVSTRTVENMVKAGEFPPAVKIGKSVYWSETAVLRWQQNRFAEQEAWNN